MTAKLKPAAPGFGAAVRFGAATATANGSVFDFAEIAVRRKGSGT
jgi:hypothetical protein